MISASTMRFSAAILFLLLTITILHSSHSWSLSNEIRGIHSHLLSDTQKKNILTNLAKHQKTAGDAMTVVGFLSSSHESLVANPNIVQKMLGGIQTLTEYLEESGIQQEIAPIRNARLADNIAILGQVQKAVLNGADRRDTVLSSLSTQDVIDKFTLEEAARYAVAAYGDAAIQAANMDFKGEFDLRQGDWTKERVARHIGLPPQDLVLVDVKYSGDATQLRHYLAVDHEHQKVVLVIRGTFCASDATVDVIGYSRSFCGGEAHAGIALMTERLWDLVADDVLKALAKNDGYELIITGHSLGAGTALLLNIILHQDKRLQGQTFRTFAFASPPVYSPLSAIPNACQTAVNYVHDSDDVPLLSGDSVRHTVACLRTVDECCKDMKLVDKAKLILGTEPPNDTLIQNVTETFYTPLAVKQGMPVLAAPVMAVVWACEKRNKPGKFDMKVCDPMLLSQKGIYMDSQSVLDHYPTRYEWAFDNIVL